MFERGVDIRYVVIMYFDTNTEKTYKQTRKKIAKKGISNNYSDMNIRLHVRLASFNSVDERIV